MIVISVKEKNAIFKAADEQLAARMLAAGLRKPNANLIKQTFRKLDIEAIAPIYIGKLNKEADSVRTEHKSTTLDKRVKARKLLRASKDLRSWKSGKTAGIQLENHRLMQAYKTSKGVS